MKQTTRLPDFCGRRHKRAVRSSEPWAGPFCAICSSNCRGACDGLPSSPIARAASSRCPSSLLRFPAHLIPLAQASYPTCPRTYSPGSGKHTQIGRMPRLRPAASFQWLGYSPAGCLNPLLARTRIPSPLLVQRLLLNRPTARNNGTSSVLDYKPQRRPLDCRARGKPHANSAISSRSAARSIASSRQSKRMRQLRLVRRHGRPAPGAEEQPGRPAAAPNAETRLNIIRQCNDLTRGEILEKMGLKGDKSGEMSASKSPNGADEKQPGAAERGKEVRGR